MSKENSAYAVVENFTNFPACNVCGMAMASDADAALVNPKTKYCNLCGMKVEAEHGSGNNGNKFCCANCEAKFNKFIRAKRWLRKDSRWPQNDS